MLAHHLDIVRTVAHIAQPVRFGNHCVGDNNTDKCAVSTILGLQGMGAQGIQGIGSGLAIMHFLFLNIDFAIPTHRAPSHHLKDWCLFSACVGGGMLDCKTPYDDPI